MKYGSLCSGMEAATAAWHPYGWQPQFFSEIDNTASRFLAAKYPDVPNLGDMTKFKEWPDYDLDLLVGGTPCQSFSVAGLRKGLEDPRGNLMLTYLGVADRYRPKWLVWENVPGVLSSSGGRDFGSFLGALAELGYGWAYRVLDAQFVRTQSHPWAVPQRRRRVFVVGCLGDWRRAAAVLFERESLSGHPPPRREAGKGFTHGVAPSLTSSGRGVERAGDTRGQDAVVAEVITSTGSVAHCLNAGAMGRIDYKTETMVAHALRGEGFNASEEGTGRGTPLIPVMAIQGTAARENPDSGPDGIGVRTDGAAYTLEARQEVQAVAFQTRGSNIALGDVSGTLGSNADRASGGAPMIAFDRKGTQVQFSEGPHDTANIRAASGGSSKSYVATSYAVRRLTPLECLRLQGFPEYKATLYVRPCCTDPQKNDVPAAIQSRKSPRYASPVSAKGSVPSVRFVETHSNSSHPSPAQPAVLHVLINSGRQEVQIRRAGKLIWSANAAGKPSASALSMPVGDFVRLAVAMTITAARITRDGKAAPSPRMKNSTHPESGHWLVEMYGVGTSPHASDAESSISAVSDLSTSITSSDGPPGRNWEQTAATLFSCAAAVIVSYIPSLTPSIYSSDLLIEIEDDYFAAAEPIADGPKYKMLGNSMAVNVMSWIGQRIAIEDMME